MTSLYKTKTLNSVILLYVKWSNFWNIKYKFSKFSPILGHDFEMSCAKVHKNRFRIDGEIDKKHALQIIVS